MSDEKFDGIQFHHEDPPTPLYLTILYYSLVIWGAVYAGYYLVSGWSSQGEFQEKIDAYNSKHNSRISIGLEER